MFWGIVMVVAITGYVVLTISMNLKRNKDAKEKGEIVEANP